MECWLLSSKKIHLETLKLRPSSCHNLPHLISPFPVPYIRMLCASSVKSLLTNDLSSRMCLCLDSMSAGSFNVKGNVAAYLYADIAKRRQFKKLGSVNLSTLFVDARYRQHLSVKVLSNHIVRGCSRKRRRPRSQRLTIVGEVGGQYEDTFIDVKKELITYFTFKAVRTVLEQLYEMNPPQYAWFNNFVADNVPCSATRFLQTLVKERQELAERVMITRLTLYGRWIKKCDHGEIYNEISDENLKLMRERLLETIIWPTDETPTDGIEG